MYIRTSFVGSTLRVPSIRIYILIDPIFNKSFVQSQVKKFDFVKFSFSTYKMLLTNTDYPQPVSGKLDQLPSVLRSGDCSNPHLERVHMDSVKHITSKYRQIWHLDEEMKWLLLRIVGGVYEQNTVVKKLSVLMFGNPKGQSFLVIMFTLPMRNRIPKCTVQILCTRAIED